MFMDEKAVWNKIAKVSYNVPKMEEKEKVSFIIVTSPKNYELCKKIVELRRKLKIIMFLVKIPDNHFISFNHRTL